MVSCTQSQMSEAKVSAPVEVPKLNYTIDLHVWHRRDATTAQTWTHIKNNAQVHYLKHGIVPMFRLFTIELNNPDSSYDCRAGNAVLKTYCKDTLIETNSSRTFGGTLKCLYSGQNGLLDCTDREVLTFFVFYRKAGDTLSSYSVDSLKYEILMDQSGMAY